MIGRQALWSLVAAVVAVLALVYWRGFYWSHAIFTGIAVGALVYSALRTYDHMRGMFRD